MGGCAHELGAARARHSPPHRLGGTAQRGIPRHPTELATWQSADGEFPRRLLSPSARVTTPLPHLREPGCAPGRLPALGWVHPRRRARAASRAGRTRPRSPPAPSRLAPLAAPGRRRAYRLNKQPAAQDLDMQIRGALPARCSNRQSAGLGRCERMWRPSSPEPLASSVARDSGLAALH